MFVGKTLLTIIQIFRNAFVILKTFQFFFNFLFNFSKNGRTGLNCRDVPVKPENFDYRQKLWNWSPKRIGTVSNKIIHNNLQI